MKYITFSDLAKDIRDNIWKIPHDIEFVIGIPRAGIICGSMVAEYINVPLIDINSFVQGVEPSGGVRLTLRNKTEKKERPKVLVIDDAVFTGKAFKESKEKLKPFDEKYEFVYCSVYLEGPGIDAADIYFVDVRDYTRLGHQVTYEWNIFNHLPYIMERAMFDMDGVFCVDPPDDRNEEEYIKYIKDAIPLFIPKVKIGKIVTYRISKNMEITQKWLEKWGINYNHLIMFKANSREERDTSGISPAVMKAKLYGEDKDAVLFVESDDWQARRIYEMTGKEVYCVSTNKLYGGR